MAEVIYRGDEALVDVYVAASGEEPDDEKSGYSNEPLVELSDRPDNGRGEHKMPNPPMLHCGIEQACETEYTCHSQEWSSQMTC